MPPMRDLLLLVLLPIAAVAAWAGWRTWRGRPPGRPLLNAVVSLLLAVYVLVTAGLGLFWVAHQHLPVFDWHYVFGYAMLVLLVVHLALNARTLWFQLRRSRTPAPAPLPRAAGRRGVVGVLGGVGVAGVAGAAAAAGLGYLLGLRHGRTEIHVAATADAGSPAAALDAVERFHALSSHSRGGLVSRSPSTDWGPAVPPFKADAAAPRVALGEAGRPASTAQSSALAIDTLAALLWHTAGVREWRGGIAFRTAPSSGALFATELTLAVRRVDGLPAGIWHYQPEAHALALLRPGEPPVALLPPGATAVVWATAVFRRSGRKYGDRAYRYVLADLGHALENLRVAGAAAGVALRWLPVFDEQAAAQALGVDDREEGVLAAARLEVMVPPCGAGADDGSPAGARTALVPRTFVPAPAPPGQPVRLGVTGWIHAASSLHGPLPGPAPVLPAASALPPAPGEQALPAAVDPAMPPWQRIAQRRSRRRFGAGPLPLAAASTLLGALRAQPVQLSAAVRVHVLTPAVAALPSAVWRYDPLRHVLQPLRRLERGTLHRLAKAAALDQDAAGAAAVVLALSIDRSAWAADPLGPARGYRHALIEAGMVGERAYLAAAALGIGVCAIGAFFDDELSALLELDAQREWPVHLVVLGPVDTD